MLANIRLARRPSALVLVGLVVVAVVAAASWIGGASLAVAGDPIGSVGPQAGQPTPDPTGLSPTDSLALAGKARIFLAGIGIRPQSLRVARSFDGTRGIRLDSATGLDAAGRPIVDVEWDAETGKLRRVTRYVRDFGLFATRSGRQGLERTASGWLRRVGLSEPSEAPQVSWDQGMASWQALWTRHIDGVAAPEDFLSVWVLPDGGLRALADETSSQVSESSIGISPTEAQLVVRRFFDQGPAPRPVTIGEPRLEWLHANDFVNPTLSDGADPSLRLAFIVPYRIALSATESAEGMLWVDAGTGALMGGGAIP